MNVELSVWQVTASLCTGLPRTGDSWCASGLYFLFTVVFNYDVLVLLFKLI